MRRIGGMNLKRKIGHARRVRNPRKRGDGVLRRPNMHVVGRDDVLRASCRGGGITVSLREMADRGGGAPSSATRRAAERLSATKRRARAQDARRASRRQRREIGVDDRVLDLGQRRPLRSPEGRGWVRESMNPSPRLASPVRRPSTEKVACQIRSSRLPAGGDRGRCPETQRGAPLHASRRMARSCAAHAAGPRNALVSPKARKELGVPPDPDAEFEPPAREKVEQRRRPPPRAPRFPWAASQPRCRAGCARFCPATCAVKTKGDGRPPSSSWK